MAAPVTLTATLGGGNETGGGSAEGSGTFKVEADGETGDFCYTLTAAKIGTASAAHLHSGAAGSDGDVVVPLAVTGAGSDECVAMEPAKLKPILADPASYYINVHTAEFPKGAIRGQLTKP
ncbi:CHRD domain-containing protein [Novosphingobium sp. Chol11]|uniref:CHRD domain-containing protein n=1 Tax=Novosphingobium sp. Chol11 TaxID=1385763 RepID=UPI0025D2AC76|nr:CHRD domain-containing protein [Novosphingobium sp. Chol11]